MDSLFVAPDPISPRSLNVVGEDGAMEMVGIFPIALIVPVIIKGIMTVVGTVTGITTVTIYMPCPPPYLPV